MNHPTIADPEAERAVLAAPLLAGGVPNIALAQLEALGIDEDAFADPRHRAIWRAYLGVAARRQPLDVLTVAAELRGIERLNSVGGAQYLGDITDYIPTLAHCEAHGELVLDVARVRLFLEVSQAIASEVLRAGGSGTVLPKLRALAARLPIAATSAVGASAGDHFEEAWGEVERIAETRAAGRITVARFGVPTLDGDESWSGLLDGVPRQTVTTIVGPPGSGKTTLALQAAVTTATDALAAAGGNARQSARVKVFSAEMRGPMMMLRLACVSAGVHFKRLRSGLANGDERERVFMAGIALSRLPLDIIDRKVNRGRICADDVAAHLGAAKSKHDIPLVVVDYFQHMAPCRGMSRASVTEEQERRAEMLHDAASDSDAGMILLSSMNKAGQRAAEDGKSSNTGARGAGVDFESDVLLTLIAVNPEDKGGRVQVHVDVTKDRYGDAIGGTTLWFDKTRGRFESVVDQREEAAATSDTLDESHSVGGYHRQADIAKVYDLDDQRRRAAGDAE